MDLDPQNALTTLQAGFADLSGLIVSYAFSAVGAVILLIVGYIVAGLAERSVYAGTWPDHGLRRDACAASSPRSHAMPC